MCDYVLFENATGYALFEVIEAEDMSVASDRSLTLPTEAVTRRWLKAFPFQILRAFGVRMGVAESAPFSDFGKERLSAFWVPTAPARLPLLLPLGQAQITRPLPSHIRSSSPPPRAP
jgi:hypothetical protein